MNIIKNGVKKIVGAYDRKRYEATNILDTTCRIGRRTNLISSEIGYYSSCNARCSIAYSTIGRYTQLGQFVLINPRDHIYQNFLISDDAYMENEEVFDKGLAEFDGYQVKIGNDVWICDRAIVLSHVEIGDGAIVAAGSVVANSIPSYAVVGGYPLSL